MRIRNKGVARDNVIANGSEVLDKPPPSTAGFSHG